MLKLPARLSLVALLIALGLAPAGRVDAKLYKWVDENGNVTYSQKKPPDRKTETIELKGIGPADSNAEKRLDKARESFDKTRRERAKDEFDKAESGRRAKLNKKNCELAQQNLQVLEEGGRIKAKNDKGETYYIDQSELATKLAKAREQIKEFCG